MQERTTTATKAPAVLAPDANAPTAPVSGIGTRVRVPARHLPAPRPVTARLIKRALWAALAIALLVAIALGLRPSPVAVETAAVARGTLVVTVDEDGRSRVKDRYLVSAPLAGSIARIGLRAGDSVKQGEVLARLVPLAPSLLDPRSRAEAQARVAAARAALSQSATAVERARAAHAFARRDLERQRVLLAEGATAHQAAEQAELAERMRREEAASAEFGRQVAASELRVAQAALARLGSGSVEEFAIRAPVRGRVLRVMQESEGVVQPGTPLLEIGDPAALEIVVDVLTTDAVGIRTGAPVRIERWGGDATLAGRVTRVEPSAFTRLSALGVEEQRVNVVIGLNGPPASYAALGDGYRVEVGIVVWERAGRLLVPVGGVHRQGDGWAAYVVEAGRARLRSVRIGRRNGTDAEVLEGLREGERVVLYPTDNVEDGARVAER
jgi:HlyD family secretion protein